MAVTTLTELFLKVATYNNAGGPRMSAYLANMCRTVFSKLSAVLAAICGVITTLSSVMRG